MSNDEILDKILNALYEEESGKISVAVFFNNNHDLDNSLYPKFVDRMEAEGLAVCKSPRHIMLITDFGRKIGENGGWLVHLEEVNKENNRKLRKENLEIENLRWQSKLRKWQVKAFPWVFTVGIVGGICGILSFLSEFEIVDLSWMKDIFN